VIDRARNRLTYANVVSTLCLFVLLGGGAYAATKLPQNSVKSKQIKDGQVKSVDVGDDGLTGTDINEATLQGLNGELNAFRTQLQTPGAVNASGNPVDFTSLKNVPASFADGTDNTGAAPGPNSLGAAEPGVTDDEIADGAIDTEDLANGTIVDADVSPTAAIDDTKLGTISDAGKVADSALSSNVAQLGRIGQIFSGTNTFLKGLDFDSSAAAITTALDAADPGIVTALDIGTNSIKAGAATISSSELAALDGTVTRSLNLPLTSFVNTSDGATLDFTASDGTSPDLGSPSGIPVIEWDADTDGGGADVADTDFVATSFTVPPDFASGGAIHILYRAFGNFPNERVFCEGGENLTGFTASDTASGSVNAIFTVRVLEAVDYDAGDSIHIRCRVDDGSGGSTANDPIRFHSVAFEYVSQR